MTNNASSSKRTVIEHVLWRLSDLGIEHVFGVAGDFAFPINDAICAHPKLQWTGSCNELNAAYSADGYARTRGMAAVCTTYGVGELSAIAGIAGAYAENLPVFHLVGMPASHTQAARRLVHHTLGNGEFELFYNMAGPTLCARAILTPQNCAQETERLIAAALHHRRPVYMAFPTDHADSLVLGKAEPYAETKSDPESLSAAVAAIAKATNNAGSACVLPGILTTRVGLKKLVTDLVRSSNLPYATMFMDKTALDETLPSFVGMYDGQLMNPEVRNFVESCDFVLGIGVMMTDFNSGAFTAKIEQKKSANILLHSVRVGERTYGNVEMKDVLAALMSTLTHRENVKPHVQARFQDPLPIARKSKITADYLYQKWEQMLRAGDNLFAETGTTSMGIAFAKMPTKSNFHNQSLWGSIGWATPAAFGGALAAPERRTILVTGEGSHQLTAQEVSQFHRHGLKPIIFVLNNDGYLIERLLCKDPESSYNDLARWQYHKLPEALGCDGWFTAKVSTCEELDKAIAQAETADTGVYIEVVTDRYAASALAQKMHDSQDTLYG